MKVKTRYVQVTGQGALAALVHHLCYSHCWFQVTPMSDDEYNVEVKEDSSDVLPRIFYHHSGEVTL